MPGLGISIDPVVQDNFIADLGSDMLHERAVACTCRGEDVFAGMVEDGMARRTEPHCERCGGDGWLYRDPRVVRGLVTSARNRTQLIEAGVARPGDMLFSPPVRQQPGCAGSHLGSRLGMWDKLTASWPEPLDDGQSLVRAAAAIGHNAGLRSGVSVDEDRLWYEPARAIWCEDEDGETYTENADYELSGRVLRWIGARRPRVRARYTLKYEAYLEWIVAEPPQERRHAGRALPQAAVLRKRHAAILTGDLPTESDRLPLKSRWRC